MVKRFIQLVLLLLVFSILFLSYLSIYGISTDKFNNLITQKIYERNKNLDIRINKIKIFLNINNLNFELKTKNPRVFFKNKEIKIKSISTDFKLKNFFSKKINLEEIKISTDKNKIQNLIEVARIYKNNPQLFILSKTVKDGFVSIDSKISFNDDGSIKRNFFIDGKIKNLKIKLLNDNIIENINLNFLIKDKDYLIYNFSSIYQSIKIKSNQIKIFDNTKDLTFQGDISNIENQLDPSKFSFFVNDTFKNFFKEDITISSSNKFSFKLSKKMKISDTRVQSKISIKKFEYSNDFLKSFFPGYKKNLKIENNNITFDYDNGDYKVIGKSKLNINGDIDDIRYEFNKNNKEFLYDLNFELVNSAINLKMLDYTKKKEDKGSLKIKGKYLPSSFFVLKSVKFAQDKNLIDIKNIKFNKSNKIQSIDEISLSIFNNNDNPSKLNIKRKNNNYSIIGEIFDGTKLVDEILFSKNEDNFFDLFDNLNSNVSILIDTAYLSKIDFFSSLDANLIIKNNEILNLNLLSKFPNNDEFKVSIRTNENKEKITTLFTNYAKPLVKKYKFIKGFEGGSIDFYSVKKNKKTNSNLKLYDFKLKEVPALTKLLTLASLQGIADLLSGEGIRFNEFEMKFNKEKGLMTIEEIYSLGPSISVLMEGYVQKDELISLRGTLVPATTINKAIGSIPLLGNILVGKKAGEGVFGVSFKIKGYPKDLKTTVNPIKTLTPRFITRTLEKIKKSN
tara:strand:+ start:24 stop:2225 length:2202 start_codon:yes stop_codon:yes gene_type:complete